MTALVIMDQAPTLAHSTESRVAESLIKQLGGSAYSIAQKGNYIYLGIGSRLDVVDIQDETNPLFVAQSHKLAEELRGLHLLGDYGIANSKRYIYIFDLQQPLKPTLVHTYTSSSVMNDLVISGTHAFISRSGSEPGTGGVVIMNLANPLNPVQLSNPLEGNRVKFISLKGDYAYIDYCETITGDSCTSRYAIWDIADLSAPNEIQKYGMVPYDVI